MYKPRLKKVQVPNSTMYVWYAVQDGHYKYGFTPKEAYLKLKKEYDYYHYHYLL